MVGVNWLRLGRAVEYWSTAGYTSIDAPWRVAPSYIRATMDSSDPEMAKRDTYQAIRDHRCPVGSGEQSLLYLRFSNRLPVGAFVTCTPCFRDDHVDALHRKEFMKVELMDNREVNHRRLCDMLDQALTFFRSELAPEVLHDLMVTGGTTPEGSYAYDIELGGVEIGSYGIREWSGEQWIYGTGLAEPRFSKALSLL